MRYMKNKRMLKRYLISSVLSYSAILDYGIARIVSCIRIKIIY